MFWKFLVKNGCKRSKADPCLFCKVAKGVVYLLMVHVDDILDCEGVAYLKELFFKDF